MTINQASMSRRIYPILLIVILSPVVLLVTFLLIRGLVIANQEDLRRGFDIDAAVKVQPVHPDDHLWRMFDGWADQFDFDEPPMDYTNTIDETTTELRQAALEKHGDVYREFQAWYQVEGKQLQQPTPFPNHRRIPSSLLIPNQPSQKTQSAKTVLWIGDLLLVDAISHLEQGQVEQVRQNLTAYLDLLNYLCQDIDIISFFSARGMLENLVFAVYHPDYEELALHLPLDHLPDPYQWRVNYAQAWGYSFKHLRDGWEAEVKAGGHSDATSQSMMNLGYLDIQDSAYAMTGYFCVIQDTFLKGQLAVLNPSEVLPHPESHNWLTDFNYGGRSQLWESFTYEPYFYNFAYTMVQFHLLHAKTALLQQGHEVNATTLSQKLHELGYHDLYTGKAYRFNEEEQLMVPVHPKMKAEITRHTIHEFAERGHVVLDQR